MSITNWFQVPNVTIEYRQDIAIAYDNMHNKIIQRKIVFQTKTQFSMKKQRQYGSAVPFQNKLYITFSDRLFEILGFEFVEICEVPNPDDKQQICGFNEELMLFNRNFYILRNGKFVEKRLHTRHISIHGDGLIFGFNNHSLVIMDHKLIELNDTICKELYVSGTMDVMKFDNGVLDIQVGHNAFIAVDFTLDVLRVQIALNRDQLDIILAEASDRGSNIILDIVKGFPKISLNERNKFGNNKAKEVATTGDNCFGYDSTQVLTHMNNIKYQRAENVLLENVFTQMFVLPSDSESD